MRNHNVKFFNPNIRVKHLHSDTFHWLFELQIFFLLKLIENFVILLKVIKYDCSNPSSYFIFKSGNKCLNVQINLNLTPKADKYNVHQIIHRFFFLAIGGRGDARKVLREFQAKRVHNMYTLSIKTSVFRFQLKLMKGN